MSRDLIRRLGILEQNMRSDAVRAPLTDAQRAALVALNALVVAVLLGKYQHGDDPLHALYWGMEEAHAAADRVHPLRMGFADRMRDAWAKALNGNDSVAVPPGAFTRSRMLLDRPEAGEIIQAYGGLYAQHLDFADPARGRDLWTWIDQDGSERYRWPHRAGSDRPTSGWQGQGAAAAAEYWASRTSAEAG